MTKTHVQTLKDAQVKAFKDMTKTEQSAYISAYKEAEKQDGLLTELVQIVAVTDKTGNHLPKKVIVHNNNDMTIAFRVRRCDLVSLNGTEVSRDLLPKGQALKEFKKTNEVRAVFKTVTAYVKENNQAYFDFIMNLKPGHYYNLTSIMAKNNEKGLSLYRMFEAKGLNK